MQARRLLLVIGVVMLFAVVAASLVPPPQETTEDEPGSEDTTEAAEPSPTLPIEDSGAVEIEFRAQDPRDDMADSGSRRRTRSEGADGGREGQTKTVRLDKRVIVTVTPPGPGTVELEGLGRLQVAARGNPAVLDLFTDRPGRFAVLFTPSEGSEQVLGTLAVERPPANTAE